MLRLTVARVEESVGGTLQDSFHPDEEVARDLAALLTVLCRRLITVSGKSMELYADCKDPEFGYVPFPVATSMRKTYWPPHPATVETSVHGQKVHDNNPTPKSVDPEALTALLLGLASLDYGESIVASARLDALALELIREQPDIAYQLLISSVETIANKALQGFQPNDEDKVKLQEAVFKQAKGVGLGDDIARDLALTASKRERWVKRKFTKFLTDNIDDSVWNQDDDLFETPLRILPCREDLQKTLGKIYDARSTANEISGSAVPCLGILLGWATDTGADDVCLFWVGFGFPADSVVRARSERGDQKVLGALHERIDHAGYGCRLSDGDRSQRRAARHDAVFCKGAVAKAHRASGDHTIARLPRLDEHHGQHLPPRRTPPRSRNRTAARHHTWRSFSELR